MYLNFSFHNNQLINKPLTFTCWGLALLIAFTYMLTSSHIEEVWEEAPSGATTERSIPVSSPSGDAGRYTYTIRLSTSFLTPGIFHLVPDDRVEEIRVNNEQVNLSQAVISGSLGNIYSGFYVDLSDHLIHGENQIKIAVWDIGGQGGLYGLQFKPNFVPLPAVLAVLAILLSIPLTQMYFVSWGRSSARFYGYILVFAGCVLQAYQIFTYNPMASIWSDPARHWIQGIEAVRLDPMALTDPVMYQIYVGILGKLTLKVPELVAFYTILLALAGKWFWYKFFRLLQPSKTVAVYGWAAISLLPSWLGIYSYFMQETLLIATLGLALFATWRARQKQSLNAFLFMVFCWVVAGLTRGIAIPMAAVACTWVWVAQGQKLSKAALSVLILALALGPLIIRSESFLSFWAPHGVGALSSVYAKSGNRDIHVSYERQGAKWSYGFACPSMGLKPFAPFSDWTSQRKGVVKVEINLDKGYEDWTAALAANPMTIKKYLWITKENLIYIFFGPSWPDTNPAHFVESLNYAFRWVWAPATLLMLLGTIVCARKTKFDWLLFSIIAAWFVVQVIIPISVNEGRYRKPYEGLLIAQFVCLIGLYLSSRALGRQSEPLDNEDSINNSKAVENEQ